MEARAPPSYEESCPGASTAPAADKKADGPPGEAPINVLIIGETANGKSTLIKQLGIYAGKPEVKPGIGLGNKSCTTTVTGYPVSTKLSSYYLKDHRGHEIKSKDYSELVDLTDEDATVEKRDADEDGKVFNFEIIDTPGLDDSEGNDMEIMADVIGKIGELSHLNAMIYVRNRNKPFGTSFNRLFDYIQRCMPSISQGIIVAHTGFTVEDIDLGHAQKKDICAERQAALKKAIRRNVDPPQFFMDNNPLEDCPFAITESFNACYELLKLLSTQLPLNTKGAKLLKTPNMRNVDVHVQLALERLHTRIKKKWEDELAAVNVAKMQALRTRTELSRLQNKISEIDSNIEELESTTSIVLGTKQVSEDYGLTKLIFEGALWLDEKKVHFDGDSKISHVQKSVTGGSKWHNEELRGTSWRATISAGWFRSINGSATFYTESRYKHAREIAILKSSKEETQKSISFNKETLLSGSRLDEDGEDAVAIESGKDVERCANTLGSFKSETFDIHLWPILKIFYSGHSAPTMGDIVELIRVFDNRTAELLYSI